MFHIVRDNPAGGQGCCLIFAFSEMNLTSTTRFNKSQCHGSLLPARPVPLCRSVSPAIQLHKDTKLGRSTAWYHDAVLPRTRHARKLSQQTRSSAIAVNEAQNSDDGKPGVSDFVTLGLFFGGWYMANIVFNIYNKEVLKVFPLPLTCTTVQFLVGSVLALTSWTLGLCNRPQLSTGLALRILPLAAVHTLGNLLTNVSLGAVAVSFTHTIKAMEPIFSVTLSAVFLGDKPSPLVLLTLLPIMGGVALASVSEVTFNWRGFLSAMGSNLTFQSRNVLSKKLMSKHKVQGAGTNSSAGLDNMNLFGIITCMSFLLLLPINLMLEGWRLTPPAMTAMGIADPNSVMKKVFIAGLCFHAYQQVSYMILARVSPVTHSIGNCVKRVVVIVASVLFFQNPLTTQSAIGTAVALLGVFAYSQAKKRKAATS